MEATRSTSQSWRARAATLVRKIDKAVLASSTPLTRRALRHGVAPASEHLALLSALEPRTVIDVGANKGQFALAVRLAGCRGDIYAFEPLDEAAARLRAVFDGDERLHVIQRAMADDEGTALLHESARGDSSSLLQIGDSQVRHFPGTEEVGRRTVELGRLSDEFSDVRLEAPVLLKIDVQGGELAVLRGAVPLLEDIAHVYLEVSFERLYRDQPLADEIVRFLFEHGYHLTEIGDVSFVDSRCLQADLLFSRDPEGHAD